MKTYVEPEVGQWAALTERAKQQDEVIAQRVATILQRVQRDGDNALYELAQEIDGVQLAGLEVTEAEKAEALLQVPAELKEALQLAAANIEAFHKAQLPRPVMVETVPGVCCYQRAIPIQHVGLYIPGGNAPLFSTVLMLALPAKVAGCTDVVLCTPPDKRGKVNAQIVYAASLCGVAHIYKVGGAQAIAAMAYGTATIAKRNKIFGPGNRYVTKAKLAVSSSDVAIDMPAGPSEVMVLADASARPDFVAADLLSQAEHGRDSQAMLVCHSEAFARQVEQCVAQQAARLKNSESIESSLANSKLIVFSDLAQRIAFANEYAPEHLIIAMDEPWQVANQITAAGSVFVGHYSPESAGDYASGTNHTLPTSGWAVAYSGVNIDSFIHKQTYQELTREGLARLGNTIITMADAEGLDAHAQAVKIRLQQ